LSSVRIYHPWYKWECYKDGFHEICTKFTRDQCELMYQNYFMDSKKFERDIPKLFKVWSNSCEHFLTNPNINRIAWLGQACVFISTGVTPNFKYAYNNLPLKKREECNAIAEKWIKKFSKESSDRLHKQMEMHGVFL